VRGSDIPANRLGTAKPMVIVTGWNTKQKKNPPPPPRVWGGGGGAFLYLSVSSGASYKLLKP